jgi:hypothetical protein
MREAIRTLHDWLQEIWMAIKLLWIVGYGVYFLVIGPLLLLVSAMGVDPHHPNLTHA